MQSAQCLAQSKHYVKGMSLVYQYHLIKQALFVAIL